MKDVMDKVESNRSFFDKIMQKIPGYKGYMAAEERREADKIQREFLAKRLEQGKEKIDDAKEDLLGEGILDGLDELDQLCSLIDKNANRVRYANYGMGGLFATVKITQEDLEKLYSFDFNLVEKVDTVLETLDSLVDVGEDGLKKEIRKMKKAIGEFEKYFDHRDNMIKGVE